jgi:hypothetical protein
MNKDLAKYRKSFKKNDPRINKSGRPVKIFSILAKDGYKKSQIIDSILVLMSLDKDELKTCIESSEYNGKRLTALELIIGRAILKDIAKGDLRNWDTLITRALGQPKQETEITGDKGLKIDIEFTD